MVDIVALMQRTAETQVDLVDVILAQTFQFTYAVLVSLSHLDPSILLEVNEQSLPEHSARLTEAHTSTRSRFVCAGSAASIVR